MWEHVHPVLDSWILILRKYNYNYNNNNEDMLNDMGLNRSSTKKPKGQRARKQSKPHSTDPLLNMLKTA